MSIERGEIAQQTARKKIIIDTDTASDDAVALVAALRETSVIFGMLMAVVFLGEKLSPVRVLAILLVMGGAMILRLG